MLVRRAVCLKGRTVDDNWGITSVNQNNVSFINLLRPGAENNFLHVFIVLSRK